MFLFDGNVVEEYGGRFELKIVVGDKVNDFLRELPVFDGKRTCYKLMFRGLDFIYAEVTKSIIWVLGLVHKFE